MSAILVTPCADYTAEMLGVLLQRGRPAAPSLEPRSLLDACDLRAKVKNRTNDDDRTNLRRHVP